MRALKHPVLFLRVIVLLSPFAATLIGCTGTRSALSQTVVVFVMDDGKAIPDPAYVKAGKQEVVWYSCGEKLKIDFQGKSPFPDLKCKGDSCRSGQIPLLSRSSKPYSYTATVEKNGKAASLDPEMIVW